MKNILAITIFAILFLGQSQVTYASSSRQKLEIIGAPKGLNKNTFKELFKSNGFTAIEYYNHGIIIITNSLTIENGKFYCIANPHRYDLIEEKSDWLISFDKEKATITFTNPISKEGLASAKKIKPKPIKVDESILTEGVTPAVDDAMKKLVSYKRLIELKDIKGPFGQDELRALFKKNELPLSSYGGFGNMYELIKSVQQIDDKWYVLIRTSQTKQFNTYNESIHIKAGKMIFANLP